MRIPFEISVDDLNEVHGFLYLDQGFLVIKVQQKMLGLFGGDEQVIKVEPGVVQEIRHTRGAFRDKLTIYTKKIELLDAVPGKHSTGVEVKVKRKYRMEVESFIHAVKAWKRQASSENES